MGAELPAQGTNIWRESGDWVALYNIARRGLLIFQALQTITQRNTKVLLTMGKEKGYVARS